MSPCRILIIMAAALVVSSPASSAARVRPRVSIVVKNPDPQANAARARLRRLIQRHDLVGWTFTHKVVIDGSDRVIPHSHPVLTLHDRHHNDGDLLLSTYVHEQLHWFMDARRPQVEAAIAELRRLYPKVPVGFPDGGRNAASTYEHLIICHLELAAMRALLGELRAFVLQRFWAQDHYRWIYRRVAAEGDKIAAVAKKHGLVPGVRK